MILWNWKVKMDEFLNEFWKSFLATIKSQVSGEIYDTWLAPLRLKSWDSETGKLVILALNAFKAKYVRNEWSEDIRKAAEDYFNRSVDIEISFEASKPSTYSPAMQASVQAHSDTGVMTPSSTGFSSFKQAPVVPSRTVETHGINANLTFDNFVQGGANKIPYLSSQALIENFTKEGVERSALIIYGGTGLGKTHLMNAIGNKLLNDKLVQPDRAKYISADNFVKDYIKAAQNNGYDKFRKKYEGLELLLMDDIQSLANKEGTCQEFFSIYENLINNQCQVVFTSDTYPKNIKGIPGRLRSRFSSGLQVEMQVPPLDMRVAILKRKAQDWGSCTLDDDSAFYIAQNIESNVRELEGALRTLEVYCRMTGCRQTTIAICKEALKSVIGQRKGYILIEDVQKAVANRLNVKVNDLLSKRRTKDVARARHIAMYLARKLTNESYAKIGQEFGDRNHATVLSAHDKINAERVQDNELDLDLKVLEQLIKG